MVASTSSSFYRRFECDKSVQVDERVGSEKVLAFRRDIKVSCPSLNSDLL